MCVQVEQISKEQNYQRYREERFRLTSESTNQRVLWYAHILAMSATRLFLLTAITPFLFRFHNYIGVPGGGVADPDPEPGVFVLF